MVGICGLYRGCGMHYLLYYDVVPDYAERRASFRAQHLARAWAAVERGELILGGALADPMDGALLLFNCDSVAAVEAFARGDPYVVHGLVRHWRIREWTTVVGPDASNPIRELMELSKPISRKVTKKNPKQPHAKSRRTG